jgi:hypothetical protein
MDALSAQGNLSEARPAPDAYNLDGERNPEPRPHRRYNDSALTGRVQSDLSSRPRGWVNSREHTRVNSRERQGQRHSDDSYAKVMLPSKGGATLFD